MAFFISCDSAGAHIIETRLLFLVLPTLHDTSSLSLYHDVKCRLPRISPPPPSLSSISLGGSSKLHHVSERFCWSGIAGTFMYRGPRENVTYEIILTHPVASCMSCLFYLDGFRDGRLVAVQLLFRGVLLVVFLYSYRVVFSRYVLSASMWCICTVVLTRPLLGKIPFYFIRWNLHMIAFAWCILILLAHFIHSTCLLISGDHHLDWRWLLLD